jgi:hypothetical protein
VAGNNFKATSNEASLNRSGGKYPTFYWQIKALAKISCLEVMVDYQCKAQFGNQLLPPDN